jgi:transglutaminase-like putative cysteine protease
VSQYQIPRNSLVWLLVAQAAVILPHVTRLPWWITLVCLVCGLWRVMIYQGRWNYPGRWTKVMFVVFGIVGIPIGFQTMYGVEPAVALLIVAFVLKLLEMKDKRDAGIVVLLAYFVALTEFLFLQAIPVTLYMLFAVVTITTGLVGLNQTQSHLNPLLTFKTALMLLGQSIPLMLILFVLFPRISPLWTVPLQTDVGRTGVTDSMSPGDISLLTQSDGLAFKATFKADAPKYHALYWRGLVLSEFDGTTWTQDKLLTRDAWRSNKAAPEWASDVEYQGDSVEYEIMLEPTQQNWLFALAMPELPKVSDVVMLHDFRLASQSPVRQRLRYDIKSNLNYSLERNLSDFWRYRYTRLPEQGNPRAKVLAQERFSDSNSTRAYIRQTLRMYGLEDFTYTLKPPLLGNDSMDEFLFDSRRGFCEHFAGSFVFLMRAAGIPARVVLGYHGGEYNPTGNFVSVRQFDAHAWAEVWIEDAGWIRFDPTSVVAPERIERGLEAAVESENSFLENSPLSLLKYRQLLWLTDLRLQIDALGHYWDTWVVGYTPETQVGLLEQYFGKVDRKKLGSMMLAAFFTVLGIVGLFIFSIRTRTPMSAIDKSYLRFCLAVSRLGIERRVGEGANDFAERASERFPELRTEMLMVTQLFVEAEYKGSPDPSIARKIKRAVRTFRRKSLAAL